MKDPSFHLMASDASQANYWKPREQKLVGDGFMWSGTSTIVEKIRTPKPPHIPSYCMYRNAPPSVYRSVVGMVIYP